MRLTRAKNGQQERRQRERQRVQAKHFELIAHTAQFGSSYVGVIRLMKKYVYERNFRVYRQKVFNCTILTQTSSVCRLKLCLLWSFTSHEAKHSLLFGAVDTARPRFQDQLFLSSSLSLYVYICIYMSLSLFSLSPHSLPLCWFINLAINFVNSEKEVALSRCLSMSKATKLQQPQPQRLRSSATHSKETRRRLQSRQ